MQENKRSIESHRKKQAVFAEAQACFGELGYKATTTDMIAERAEVSKGTVFTFYGKKLHLFEAVVEFSLSEITANTQAMLVGIEEPDARLRVTFLSGYDQCRDDLRTLNQFRTETRGEIAEVFQRYGRLWMKLFHNAIKLGVEQGVYRQDISVVTSAMLVFELHKALISRVFDEADANAVTREQMQAAIELFIDGLKTVSEDKNERIN